MQNFTDISRTLPVEYGNLLHYRMSFLPCIVVVLLFYVHGKHLRSCRDGQLT